MSLDLRKLNIEYDHTFPSNLDWSPDGAAIAVGFENGVLQLLSPEGQSIWRKPEAHDNMVRRVRFSPDGSRLATASVDKHVRIWSVEDGEMLADFEGADPIISVAWSNDGTKLLWDGPECCALVKDCESGETLWETTKHYEHATVNAWGPNDILATGSFDTFIHLMDYGKKEYLYSLSSYSKEITALCPLKRDTFFLASGDITGRVMLHDIESGMEIMDNQSHKDRINDIDSSHDGRAIATASTDTTVRLYSTEMAQEILSLPYFQKEVCSVAFSPDGNLLAVASVYNGINTWEVGPWIPEPIGF
ncbi:WD40 repeat domain-containing protein [Sulfidibacter corallicola]|uniref:WD40 repeat domain-containing protein n=1 Tax=Sulfidibacter corallicola TaxID=2818388 RepID=A0A8A4TM66_SULCO|nr:WD40 repeat domain-containing protein [Sulfidibacter corallicola]QTD51056.1 WD40 repeat domain-containing protein [Sulfidibacter corallicola]